MSKTLRSNSNAPKFGRKIVGKCQSDHEEEEDDQPLSELLVHIDEPESKECDSKASTAHTQLDELNVTTPDRYQRLLAMMREYYRKATTRISYMKTQQKQTAKTDIDETIPSPGDLCVLCFESTVDDGQYYGTMCSFTVEDKATQLTMSAHRNCMKCKFCQKPGATVNCCQRKPSECRLVFHAPCARKNNCFFNYSNSFRVFCPKHIPRFVLHKLNVDNKRFFRRPCINPFPRLVTGGTVYVRNDDCVYCMSPVECCAKTLAVIKTDCCQIEGTSGMRTIIRYYHWECVQNAAAAAHQDTRCPFLVEGDSEDDYKAHKFRFLNCIEVAGVAVCPGLVGKSSYHETPREREHHENGLTCYKAETSACKCPHGPTFEDPQSLDDENNYYPWEFLPPCMGASCDRRTVHRACAQLPWCFCNNDVIPENYDEKEWYCTDCIDRLNMGFDTFNDPPNKIPTWMIEHLSADDLNAYHDILSPNKHPVRDRDKTPDRVETTFEPDNQDILIDIHPNRIETALTALRDVDTSLTHKRSVNCTPRKRKSCTQTPPSNSRSRSITDFFKKDTRATSMKKQRTESPSKL